MRIFFAGHHTDKFKNGDMELQIRFTDKKKDLIQKGIWVDIPGLRSGKIYNLYFSYLVQQRD